MRNIRTAILSFIVMGIGWTFYKSGYPAIAIIVTSMAAYLCGLYDGHQIDKRSTLAGGSKGEAR